MARHLQGLPQTRINLVSLRVVLYLETPFRANVNSAWSQTNITALCTQECSNSLSSWLSAVETNCDGQTLPYEGGYLVPKSIPTKWSQGYELVCQQDRYAGKENSLERLTF